MPGQLLIDNWTLQNAGELLAGGLQGDTATELKVTDDRSGFSYQHISADVVKVSTLFQTFNHLVFADELFVDDSGVEAWSEFGDLAPLSAQHLVIPKPFLAVKDQWVNSRERLLEEFLVCDQMRELHARNLALWDAQQEQQDRFFSQLLWGGAGMLARADLLNIPYAPHPQRESWFRQVDTLFGQRSADTRLREFINEQRVKVLNRVDTGGYLARLNLPPVAALVVQEAVTPADLIRVALQVRGEYAPLRGWLGEFQQALDRDDIPGVFQREKLLQEVARHIDANCSAFPVGDTTIQIGLGWLKATMKSGSPGNSLRNQFGVRALLNRLVLGPTGNSVLGKLRKLFGEQHSRLGSDFERDYVLEQSKRATSGN